MKVLEIYEDGWDGRGGIGEPQRTGRTNDFEREFVEGREGSGIVGECGASVSVKWGLVGKSVALGASQKP